MKRKTKNIIALFLLLLTVGAVRAQVDDKGVTSTGKEIDCFTITPEDRVVNEYGAIVTQPRLTRNGKLITDDCCPTLVESSLTDTVTCVSISMAATIQKGTFKTGILQVFSNPDYTGQVGDDFPATLSDDRITAKAIGLSCNTHYYFKLVLNDQCEYTWTDSTRDATLEKATFCTVANVRTTAVSEADLSREHKYNDSDTQIDSVYDHEGNAYAVVQIGNQCWLKENMRATTSPSTGHTLMLTDTSSMYYSSVSKCASNSKYYMSNKDYGLLYNWCAALDTFKPGYAELANSTLINFTWNCTFPSSCRRGICPQGWHIPSDQDWMDLTTTAGVSHVKWNENPSGDEHCCLGKLTGGCAWPAIDNGSHPGSYLYPERNITGFSILPSGYSTESGRENEGVDAGFICSSMFISNGRCRSYDRTCYNGNEALTRNDNPITFGFSVRCLRNTPDTITFISNNGVDDTVKQIVVSGVSTQLLADTFTNAGNTFFGWTTQSDGQGQYYADRDFITTDGNVTLYALWNATGCRGIVRTDNEIGHGNYVDTVLDYDNFKYATVQIGDQCWIRSNLRSTHYSDGTAINASYYYNNTPETYGLLYNKTAVFNGAGFSSAVPSGVQGICPSGWHLPSDNEWRILLKYVDGISDYVCGTTGTPDYPNLKSGPIAAALSANTTWNNNNSDCVPGKKPETINATGFSAVAAGYYSDACNNRGVMTIFWTAANMMLPRIYYNRTYVEKDDPGNYNTYKYSVRCVRDPYTVSISFDANFGEGTMSAMNVMYKKDTTLNANQNEIMRAGWNFMGWNTKSDGSGVAYDDGGEITGTENMTLYAQWGNSYCEGMSILLDNEQGDAGKIYSVEDHEHNRYNVVKIGNQCWLKENMRCTSSPTGKSWNSSWTSSSSILSYRYITNFVQNGYLYNWSAAMDINGTDIGNVVVENHRGICPSGWHIPTLTEWQTLLAGHDAGQLSAPNSSYTGTAWGASTTANTPGNTSDPDKNETGFSVVPVGYYHSSHTNAGNYAYFWTSTSTESGKASRVYFSNGSAGITSDNYSKEYGYSVRCLRNETSTTATISFHANGGTGTMTAMNVTTMTETILNPNNNQITREGNFEFAGWNTMMDGSGFSYADGDHITPGESMVLYAQWNSYCAGSANSENESGAGNHIYSVQDHEGNEYKVVGIGNQCWLAENMRATTSPTTRSRLISSERGSFSTDSKIAKWYECDSAQYASSGLLYNACAALDIYRSGAPEIPTTNSNYGWQWSAPAEPVRGICPSGWHVPTDNEWTAMENYVVSDNHYGVNIVPTPTFGTQQHGDFPTTNAAEGTNTPIAPMLASNSTWTSSTITDATGSNSAYRNVTSFDVKATGIFNGAPAPTGFGTMAGFWTSTPVPTTYPNNIFSRHLQCQKAGVMRLATTKYILMSVRCVRDATLSISSDKASGEVKMCGASEVAVTFTATIEGGTASTYSWNTSGGSAIVSTSNTYTVNYPTAGTYTVTCTAAGATATKTVTISAGGNPATMTLCEDYTSPTATISSTNCTTESIVWKNSGNEIVQTGTDTYTATAAGYYTVTGVNSDNCTVTKTVRLGTPSGFGCAGTPRYDNEVGADGIITSVKDHQDNSYNVVSIGGYCIMAQNLRCTTSPSGHTLQNSTTGVFNTETSYYVQNTNYSNDGYLYSWRAALDTTIDVSNIAANTDVLNRRGLCPMGWHLPTKAEWNAIFGTNGTTNTCHNAGQFAAPNDSFSGDNWNTDSQSDAPGNTEAQDPDKNVTGFSAVPVGYRSGSSFSQNKFDARFWTATANSSSSAYYTYIRYNSSKLSVESGANKYDGYSVRCVRNNN